MTEDELRLIRGMRGTFNHTLADAIAQQVGSKVLQRRIRSQVVAYWNRHVAPHYGADPL